MPTTTARCSSPTRWSTRARRQPQASSGAFLEFFDDFSWEHLVSEEAELLPAVARVDPSLAERVRAEHEQLRAEARLLRAGAPDARRLQALGRLLRGHVRLEEGQLYPRFDASPPAAAVLE